MPASWSSAPGATTGGNVLAFANSAGCLPATGADALQDNGVATDHSEDDLGTNTILMSCVDNQSASVPGAPPHDWVDFYFRCATAGDTLIRFDIDGTHPLPFVLINSGWQNAFVYCTGSPNATPTDTPTSTNTPTSTPTATNTSVPTSTPTATSTSVPPSATPTRTNTPVPLSATPTRTNTPVPPTATPTTPGGCFGDLNGDGKVTGRDVSIVARSMHNDNPAGDVDHDGDVDLIDLKLVIAAMHAKVC
jgi:cell division septation protein DedD